MRHISTLEGALDGRREAQAKAGLFNTAFFTFWKTPILHVWLGPELLIRDTLAPLFVVFSLAWQLHILTGPGTLIFRGRGRVHEEFSFSVPKVLLLAVTR